MKYRFVGGSGGASIAETGISVWSVMISIVWWQVQSKGAHREAGRYRRYNPGRNSHPAPTPHGSRQALDCTRLEVANKVGDIGQRGGEQSAFLHPARM